MSTAHVLKLIVAPIQWCLIIPIWTLWLVLFLICAPKSVPKVWWEFKDILRKTVEEPY